MRIVHTYPFSAPIDENIPQLVSGLVTGGGETYPYRLSMQQAKSGDSVTFLTSLLPGVKKRVVTKGRWKIVYLSSLKPHSVQYAFAFSEFFRLVFGSYDLYFSHQLPTITSLITGIAAKLRKKPFFVQYVGFRPELNKWSKVLAKVNGLLVSKIIFPNNYAANFFNGYVDKRKYVVIPYGVDLDFYRRKSSVSRPEELKDKSKIYLLYVGRLLSSKGIDILIRSLNSLTHNYPQLELVIVGRGPFEDELKKIIKKLKLENRVHFTGFIPDDMLVNYYSAADIFILPSVYIDYYGNYHPEPEAFGLVLAEAMSCGTPVIASAVGGVTDWIFDGQNGLLFKSGSEKQLAKCITNILENPKLKQSLVSSSLKILKERHSLYQVCVDIKSLTGLV